MTEEEKQRIRLLFVFVLRLIKSESEVTTRLSAELASVLSTVSGLDPTFRDVLENRRKEVDEITAPTLNADLAQFDDAIQRVENGEWI